MIDSPTKERSVTMSSQVDTWNVLPKKLKLDELLDEQRKIQVQILKPAAKAQTEQQINANKNYLKAYVPQAKQQYDPQLVRVFLLIKINSLAALECAINKEFLESLTNLYNDLKCKQLTIRYSNSDAELFAQILLEADLVKYLTLQEIKNVLEGSCLLASTMVLLIQSVKIFLRKASYALALSFTGLSGLVKPFVSQVHHDKNHWGQIVFADLMYRILHLNKQLPDRTDRVVQDPYSMRCCPQVYGVVYDCLAEVERQLPMLVNRFHFKTLRIDGEDYHNLLQASDSAVLAMDFLLCSLNEIGSMSFLRSERILNSYLGRNHLQDSEKDAYHQLNQLMQRMIHRVAENKLICIPTLSDSMNIDNYQKDVFVSDGKLHAKWLQLELNLNAIITLEIRCGLAAIKDVYPDIKELFQDTEMESMYRRLLNEESGKDRNAYLNFVSNLWTGS